MRAPSPPRLFGDHPIFATAQTQWVTTQDGKHLRLAIWSDGARGTVHIFSGRTEYIEKYADVIQKLVSRGYAVTAHDWRGQGLSTRNQEHPMRCHIMDFAEFQLDAKAIMDACHDLPKPRKLFCHSMGGAIGLRYLHGEHEIESAVFSAPMWGIYIPLTLRPVANMITGHVDRHDRQWHCVFGTDERPYETYTPFWRNLLTTNRETYAELGQTLKTFPELGLGGPTYYWYAAAKAEMDDLLNMEAPKVPALVFVGSKEKIVDAKRLSSYTNSAQSFRLINVAGAKHETYIERPQIQDKFWDQIDSFWLMD